MSVSIQQQENIPYPEYNQLWNNQDNIMSMRWENKELITQLWMSLTYRVPQTINGEPLLVKIIDGKPPINYIGARAIVSLVQSVVNTVGSLSKITEEHAMLLLRHTKKSLRRLIVINSEEYECDSRAKQQQILQIVENVVFLQLMRAVNGHESRQSATQIVERKDEGSYRQETKGSGWGFGRKKEGYP